jgi:hypothetical protein
MEEMRKTQRKTITADEDRTLNTERATYDKLDVILEHVNVFERSEDVFNNRRPGVALAAFSLGLLLPNNLCKVHTLDMEP